MSVSPDERSFEATVVEVARLAGWKCVHFRAARTARGWKVPVAYDGQGWPDLILVRRPRLLVCELKTETGRLKPEQADWLAVLRLLPQVEVYVWKPSNWDELVETLTGQAPRKAA
jgi:hypothetical protein